MQGAAYSSDGGKLHEEVLNHARVTLVHETPELIFTVAGYENKKASYWKDKAGGISCLLTARQTHTHTQARGSDMSDFKASSSLR